MTTAELAGLLGFKLLPPATAAEIAEQRNAHFVALNAAKAERPPEPTMPQPYFPRSMGSTGGDWFDETGE